MPPSDWMQHAVQGGVLIGGLGAFGWLVWRFERHDRLVKQMGIDAKVWERGAKQVAARMDGRPEWMRRLVKKWNATGRLGTRKLNGAK